jgi:hypothetical protein
MLAFDEHERTNLSLLAFLSSFPAVWLPDILLSVKRFAYF